MTGVERSIGSTVTNDPTITYSLDGNILTRNGHTLSGYGTGNLRPHAVTQVDTPGGKKIEVGYDLNGRMNSRVHKTGTTVDSQWYFDWTGFGKPYSMFDGLDGHLFEYDASHNRIVHKRVHGLTPSQTDLEWEEVEKRIYIGGAME